MFHGSPILSRCAPKELWETREEYFEEFPLDVFRSKIDQEIRTAKYLHTVKTKGRDYYKKKK